MDSPERETPETEITLKQTQDSENAFPRREDPTDRNIVQLASGFWKCIPPKGRPQRQNELFKKS